MPFFRFATITQTRLNKCCLNLDILPVRCIVLLCCMHSRGIIGVRPHTPRPTRHVGPPIVRPSYDAYVMTSRRACCSSSIQLVGPSGRRAAWVTRAAGLRRAVGPAYVTAPPMVSTSHTIARAVYGPVGSYMLSTSRKKKKTT